MRIVVTGGRGQLGTELLRRLQMRHEVVSLDRPAHDVSDPAISATIAALRPQWVVHAAAFTDVDGCAQDPSRAEQINGYGTLYVARGCLEAGARLCYISTNEVFDGEQDAPYREDDAPRPINAYGRSKYLGEQFAQATCPTSIIVRTAWLFGPQSERNFVRKILQAAHKGPLRVVLDEVGSPTYAPDLAEGLLQLLELDAAPGVYHLTNAGGCSRYEFACTILTLAGHDVPVEPISASEWPRASTPPRQSRLLNTRAAALGVRPRPWREALREYLQRLRLHD